MIAVLLHLAAVSRSWVMLGVAAWGWGYWIWRTSGGSQALARGVWVWCSLAGFAAQALLLQGLVYAGLPLRWTAWPVWAVALAGVAGWIGTGRRKPPSVRPIRRDMLGLVTTVGLVLLLQSASLLKVGPGDYYGTGRVDQANYVFAAQYLVELPVTAEAGDVGLAPWRLKGMEMLEQRLTQSVVHGAAAVWTGTDAQHAYGAVSVFFLGLLAAAVHGWLRTALSAPRWLAVLGGVWAAVTPGVTRVHLDGFLSQTATLFVFPALVAVNWPGRHSRRMRLVCTVPMLGFLAGAYTEFFPVGLVLAVSLVLAATGPGRERVRDAAVMLAGALAVNPGYLSRMGIFFLQQFRHAADAGYLHALVTDSGTWRGWGRLYFDVPAPAAVAGGLVMLGLMLLTAVLLPARRRLILGVLLLGPLGFLGALFIRPQLPVYAFAKLLLSLAPLATALAAAGLGLLWRRGRGLGRMFTAGAVGLGLAVSLATATFQHRLVWQAAIFPLDVLTSPGLHAARRQAEQHPERTCLVDHPHPLIGGWLCYFARRSDVYYDQYSLLDRVVPSEDHAFRKIPGAGRTLWWMDPDKSGPVHGQEPSCLLQVEHASAVTGVPDGHTFVAGALVVFRITRPAGAETRRELWLDFTARSLAGAERVTLELTDAAGGRQRVDFIGAARLRFALAVPRDESAWILHTQATGRIEGAGPIVLQNLSLESAGTPVYPGLRVAQMLR